MNIPVQNGLLPQGFCPSDYQSILNAFSAQQFINFTNIANGFVISSTPPADHSVGWLQLDSLGRPVRLYAFAQGAWLSPHPIQPGFTMIWPQALPVALNASNGLINYDGGDGNLPPYSAISGAMWQLANASLDGTGTQIMGARMPLTVGTLTSGKIVNAGDVGGEENHKLTVQEMFPHVHGEQIANNRAVPNGGTPSTNGDFMGPSTNGGTEFLTRSVGGDPATGNPPTNSLGHNTMSLYFGVYMLQRTSRLFYVVNP